MKVYWKEIKDGYRLHLSACIQLYLMFLLKHVLLCLGHSGGYALCYSKNVNEAPSFGLCPVVSFNINRLNISDTTKAGTEAAPWEIK